MPDTLALQVDGLQQKEFSLSPKPTAGSLTAGSLRAYYSGGAAPED